MSIVQLIPGVMSREQLFSLMAPEAQIALEQSYIPKIHASQRVVTDTIKAGKTVYGINTGFGKLASQIISQDQLGQLQKNLVLSHATGTGKLLPVAICRLIWVLKLNNLCQGYSGCSMALVEMMLAMFNAGITPLIPEKGSVGASGDLVPLAHMALPILGEGEVIYKGQRCLANVALKDAGLKPFQLGPKEGLALLNGMQVSTAMALSALWQAENLFQHAIMIGALTVDALAGSDTPFDERIHLVRGHQAQIDCARWYRDYLAGSPIRLSHQHCQKVQDPYSLRCQPQVMGACLSELRHAAQALLTEANGISDNPLVFSDSQSILSGGNFHGEVVAMAADNMALAIAEIGALSERRVALLIDSNMSGLPPFLVEDGGLNSGFMIAHVTAAACASDNKALAHPHSVDSLPTSANQEDHVSMAANAARRLTAMLDNTLSILAIELLASCQALEFRKPLSTSKRLEQAYQALRAVVPAYTKDRFFAPDIEASKKLILSGQLRVNEVVTPC